MTASFRRTGVQRCPRPRDGVALVAALALLTLAAALLAGACSASFSLLHSARSVRAIAYADAAARRATLDVLASWGAGPTLAVGAFVDDAPFVTAAPARVVIRTRVARISAHLYTVTADARLGEGANPLAHRRARLVVEYPGESNPMEARGPPIPIARWSSAGLY